MVDSTKVIVIGVVVAVVYFLLKFIEMRFVDPENQKPIKILVRDAIMVCISAVLGVFVLNQFENIGIGGGSGVRRYTRILDFANLNGRDWAVRASQ
jgi:hypothetical protein